jgi:transposase
MTLSFLGIDVAKATLVLALLKGEQTHRAEFANTTAGIEQLLAWLRKRKAGSVHACLEATGTYGEEVAQALHDADHTVSVVNPARIVAYARSQLARNKTDQADAALIARFCQKEQPAAWTPPSAELRELRALVRHLAAMQQMRQAEANRLGAGPHPTLIRDALEAHLAFLDAQIVTLTTQIDEHISLHPDLAHQRDLLVSIKGIGDRTAAKLLAELGDIRAFGSARELAAYAGLNPRQFRSGSSIHKRRRLSKIGNAAVRAALFFPAIVAKQHNPLVRAFCARLSARGMVPMAVVGAAMRKLLHIVYGVVRSGKPFDPHYGQEAPAV